MPEPRDKTAKGIDWDAQPLGQVSDAEVARRLGVYPPVVGGARRRRGIPAYRGPTDRSPRGIDWDAQPLGKMTDGDLAARLGVHPSTPTNQRKKRGIPPYVSGADTMRAWDVRAAELG